MSQRIPDIDSAIPLAALERVRGVVRHWKIFAPSAPLERFLSQEIPQAQIDVMEQVGWHIAAGVNRKAIENARRNVYRN